MSNILRPDDVTGRPYDWTQDWTNRWKSSASSEAPMDTIDDTPKPLNEGIEEVPMQDLVHRGPVGEVPNHDLVLRETGVLYRQGTMWQIIVATGSGEPGFSDLRDAVLRTLAMLDEYARDRITDNSWAGGSTLHWEELRQERLRADNYLRSFRP